MFNHAPVIATTQFFSTATNGQVAENVGVGTSLFILIAYDPDGDTKGYALVDDYGLFSIDGNGIVSLTGALDYETTPSYVLRIAVSDGTDSVFEDITLTISDANEAPVFTQNHYFASVAENDATAAVETVSASIDAGETIAYSITAGGSGVFAIDENSGAITLKRALDFENEPTAYTLTINAYDGHYHTTAQVTVNVTDVNDNAPTLTAIQTTAALVEQTAAAPIDTGITFMASDVDTNTSFSESDFAVSDAVTGAVDPRFAIVADGNHWKLQLKAGATLDYEDADDQSIALMVKVNDGIYSDEAEVTVTVTDINDNAPTLTAIQATASLAEQTAATPTDTGITFTASDVDSNTSFSATDFAVSDARFQVVADGNDGTNWKLQLKTGATLNYEDANDRSIVLNVKVNDGIYDSDDVVVTINVTDANDAPVFNEYALQWFATFAADGNVAEDIAIDTPIAVIWASDDDGNSLTYRLLDGASAHLFKINESTGIISVKAALDYETATSHTLTIEASDGSATTTTDITIDVVNINDTAPVLDTNRTAVSLTEQTAATAVDTGIILTPSDPDGLHTFSDADFTLSGDARFEIVAAGNDWKLQLKTGATLDHENADDRTIALNVKVNDGGYDSNDVAIVITVVDVNDNAPVLSANQTTASLAEQTTTTAVDTGITFTVSDADATSTFSDTDFEISGDNRFEVVADGDDWKLQLKADKTLDYEDADDRTIALNVKVNDGTHDSDEVAVTISVSDVNDNTPTLTANQATVSLAEQTAATSVDTGITFRTRDVDTNTSFIAADFTISGDDRFEIIADGNNWKLQLKEGATLDHEDADDRVIALTIKVNDGRHDSNDVAVTINVSDVNDNAPVLAAVQAAASLAEQTATTAVDTGITFIAYDADATNTFSTADFTVSDDRFQIVADGNDGYYWKLQLKEGETLNYEDANDRSIVLNVNVNDGVHDSHAIAVTLNVSDANDAPVFDAYAPQWFGTFASGNVAEDTATNTPIAVMWASDEDGDSITYRLVPNASSHLFKIDTNAGIISVKSALDFETTTSHTLTIEASDNKGGTTTTDVTINVVNINNTAPTLTANQNTASLIEQTAATAVDTGIILTPSDPDGLHTFSDEDFTLSGDARFEIVAAGNNWKLQLKTGATLDHENAGDRTIALNVKVSDGGYDSNDVAVTINVTDVNDTAPVLVANQATASLTEQEATAAVNTGITFTASDADANTSFAASDFTVLGDERFEVVADGWRWKLQLKRGSSLNYENANDRSIALTVKVNDGIHDSNDVAVTINVTDVNEFAPVLAVNQTTISLAEQDATVAVDTGITFTVRDADASSTFSTSDFSVSGDNRFQVVADGNGWKLQLKRGSSLNYENANDRSIALTVKVNDGIHDSNNIPVTINVTDVNEAPVLVANQATASLAEQVATAAVATGITFTASDVDTNTSFAASDFTVSDDRFEVVANGNSWKLQLKAGKWLDYRIPTDRSIDLTVKVSDGVHDSEDIAVTVNVTDVANNAPRIDVGTTIDNGRVEEQTATSSLSTGFGFIPSDRDGTIFTSDSFIITGTDGNIDDRFEIFSTGYFWYLYLKAGETLDYDNPAHRFIHLTFVVSDGVNVSSPNSISTVTVKTVLRIDGTGGNNVIKGNSDFENIYGYGGNDTIYGGAGEDLIDGGNGNDIIYSGAGDDLIRSGKTGENTLYGGAGDDRVYGGNDDDTLYGGAGDDHIFGVDDNDILYGSAGDDRFYGSFGDDTLYGGTGIDWFYGGKNNDLFYLDIANAEEGNVNSDVAIDFSRGGTDGIDRILIEVSSADKTTIDGLATDQEKLNKLMDIADIRWVKAHEHLMQGNTSYGYNRAIKDTIIYDKRGTSRTDDDIILMVLDDFDDDLTFDMFQIVLEDIITGTSGSETLSGTGRNSVIDAGSGHDTVYGDAGDDIIRGGSGYDTLYGGEDNDLLYGGRDKDFLHGEGGIDILYGNYGRDRFVLDIVNAGADDVDIVADFTRVGGYNYDFIRVDTADGDETSFAALGLRIEQVANKVIAGHETGVNNASIMDTVIYKIIGQADTASNGETDDIALMIIEDYTITDASFPYMVDLV